MNKLRPEFKVGILVVTGLVLLVIGVNYLKGFNIFARSTSYYAVYDNVSGLAVSNPVIINGYKVGQVRRIEFLRGGQGELIVEFVVEHPNLHFPLNSVAMIHSSDLLGTKAIRIDRGDSPDLAMPGDTILNNVEDDIAAQVAKQIEPLQRKTTDLIKSVERVIVDIESVFSEENTSRLPALLSSAQQMVTSLENTAANLDSTVAENRTSFNQVMSNVASLSTSLESTSGDLTNVIQNFSTLSDTLSRIEFAQTMARANQALEDVSTITSKIASGEGTLGKLLVSDSLHNGLVATNAELQLLLDDLQMHPWKYVQVNLIGRKQKSEFSKKDLQRLRAIIEDELDAQNNVSSSNE